MWRHQVDLAGGPESGDFSRLRFLARPPTRVECSLWLFLFRPHPIWVQDVLLVAFEDKICSKPRPDAWCAPRKPVTARHRPTFRPQNRRNRGATHSPFTGPVVRPPGPPKVGGKIAA